MFIQAHAKLAREIQQKKEELYDVITKAERSSRTSTWRNMRLHQHLSVEITPRPHDSDWYDIEQIAIAYFFFLSCVTGADVI
jgi:hypothetical protein